MKVGHVTWLLSREGGGIPEVVLSLGGAQRSLGLEVCAFGIDAGSGLPLEGGCAVKTSAPVGPWALGYQPRLWSDVVGYGPDVLHLHGLFSFSSFVARRWSRRPGLSIVSPHGMLEPWALRRSAWKKALFRAVVEDANLARARCLHALNEQEAEHFRALGLTQPIAIIPNGVDVPMLEPRTSRGVPGRVNEQRKVLLFLGRIHPKKGLINLVEAWGRTVRQRPALRDEWLVAIAGPDQVGHADEVKGRIEGLRLGDTVELVGPVYGSRKREWLDAASAFVLPSFSEGFSMAVLEAMASRVPVLITPQCNFDVEAIGAGLLAEPDVGSLERALGALLAMRDDERAALGARGRAAVERTYSWPVVASSFGEVYRWLAGGGSRPTSVEV